MASGRVFDLDGILKAVDAMVDAIDKETEQKLFTDGCEGAAPRKLDKGLSDLGSLLDKSRDGAAEVRVSPDAMEVQVDLYPPSGQGKPLLLDEVLYLLEKRGVVHGILEPVIRSALNEVVLGQKTLEGVVIARGTPAVDHLAERWDILPALLEKKSQLDQKAAFLDLRAVSPFILVKAGELLALRVEEQAGSQGWDVLGTPLPYKDKVPLNMKPGKNVVEGAEGFVAACEGCFRVQRDHFWVDEILVLRSGVGYETGHIDFAGDVHITGEIASGFRIWAGGSVFSTRVIDATEVISGGDVSTPFGIIGREGSSVKAEGRVRAKFLEGVYVLARGPIEVQTSVLNCLLQTLDQVTLGEKGLIMGGRIEALNGVEAFQIGGERGGKSEIVLGMDFAALERIAWARDQVLSLVKQLKTLEAQKVRHPDQAEVLHQACTKVRAQILKLSEQCRDLACQVDRNDDATLTVRGLVFPGTTIEICHVSYIVPRPMARVKFMLDKHRGVIRGLSL